MLIRFFVSNFLSFNETTEFSMVAGQGTAHQQQLVKSKKRHIPTLLRAGLLYGANGSGKSNFVKAIDFAQKLVCGFELKDLAFEPFKHQTKAEIPSCFQFDILLNDTIYSYGFEILNHQIHTEYLYERGTTKDKIIFERKNAEDGKTLTSFDIHFKNKEQQHFLEFVAKGCPKSTLFLRECKRRNVWTEVENVKEVENIYTWIIYNLRIMFPNSFLSTKAINNTIYIDLLNKFGVKINEIKWIKAKMHENILDLIKSNSYIIYNMKKDDDFLIKSKDGNNLFLFKKEKENGGIFAYKFTSRHEGSDAIFEFSEESDGTKRLFDFLPIVSRKVDYTIIIDEIDRSLHPHLSKAILSYFLEHQQDTKMQFIATTHESSLLDLDLLRKDEIWFAEKNKTGATELYSLEEFKPRADTEIRRGYLQGRYGAIPFIPNSANQNW